MLLDHPRRATAAPADPASAHASPPRVQEPAPSAEADGHGVHADAPEGGPEHRDHHGHHTHHEHQLHVVSHATGKRHVLHDVLDLLGLLLVGLIAWVLWPASLGGSTHIIVVQGHSMEPVFHLGDAIVVKENDDPQIGDIIVFEVPADEPGAGSLVVHRIVGFRADGTITTRGDNRTIEDPFHIARGDVLGTPAWTLPHVGRMIGLASNPFVVGGCIGLLSLLMLLPGKDDEKDDEQEPEPSPAAAAGDEPAMPRRAVDPAKVERRRKAMAELVPRRGRRLGHGVTAPAAPPGPADTSPVDVPVTAATDDGPEVVAPRISPAVAARVRSLSDPSTLEPGSMGQDEFDDLLSRLGPDT